MRPAAACLWLLMAVAAVADSWPGYTPVSRLRNSGAMSRSCSRGGVEVSVDAWGGLRRRVDGGPWRPVGVCADGSLWDVQFLDERTVLAVGGDFEPLTGVSRAAAMISVDGGQTFGRLDVGQFPAWWSIETVGDRRVVVSGAAEPTAGSTRYESTDGGKRWTPIPGGRRWTTVDVRDDRNGPSRLRVVCSAIDRIPWELIGAESLENGSPVDVVVTGNDAHAETCWRAARAVAAVGGASIRFGPDALEDIESDADRRRGDRWLFDRQLTIGRTGDWRFDDSADPPPARLSPAGCLTSDWSDDAAMTLYPRPTLRGMPTVVRGDGAPGPRPGRLIETTRRPEPAARHRLQTAAARRGRPPADAAALPTRLPTTAAGDRQRMAWRALIDAGSGATEPSDGMRRHREVVEVIAEQLPGTPVGRLAAARYASLSGAIEHAVLPGEWAGVDRPAGHLSTLSPFAPRDAVPVIRAVGHVSPLNGSAVGERPREIDLRWSGHPLVIAASDRDGFAAMIAASPWSGLIRDHGESVVRSLSRRPVLDGRFDDWPGGVSTDPYLGVDRGYLYLALPVGSRRVSLDFDGDVWTRWVIRIDGDSATVRIDDLVPIDIRVYAAGGPDGTELAIDRRDLPDVDSDRVFLAVEPERRRGGPMALPSAEKWGWFRWEAGDRDGDRR